MLVIQLQPWQLPCTSPYAHAESETVQHVHRFQSDGHVGLQHLEIGSRPHELYEELVDHQQSHCVLQ